MLHGMKLKRWFSLSLVCILLSACKVELHTEVPETEANEMIALLSANGVSATKSDGEKGLVTLSVESSQFSQAVDVLRENGYPKDQFDNLGTMFQKQGLISSPLEEHVRYVFGLSQTVSETLSHIDGVVTARVHVVMPNDTNNDEAAAAPSAAVFLKTRPGTDLDELTPRIKELVRASVPGVSYDSVVVTIFEADAPVAAAAAATTNAPTQREIMGIRYDASSHGTIMVAVAVIGGLFAVLLGVIVYLVVPSKVADRFHPPRVSGP